MYIYIYYIYIYMCVLYGDSFWLYIYAVAVYMWWGRLSDVDDRSG